MCNDPLADAVLGTAVTAIIIDKIAKIFRVLIKFISFSSNIR